MRFRSRAALFVGVSSRLNASARADLDAAKVDASKTALAAFKEMAKDSAKSGNAPRESDPAPAQGLALACADVMDDPAVKEGLQKFAAAIGS